MAKYATTGFFPDHCHMVSYQGLLKIVIIFKARGVVDKAYSDGDFRE